MTQTFFYSLSADLNDIEKKGADLNYNVPLMSTHCHTGQSGAFE